MNHRFGPQPAPENTKPMRHCILFLLMVALTAPAITSCHKSDPPAPVPYTRFKVDGTTKAYYGFSRFSKDFCSSSTFCCRFYLNAQSEISEQIKFGIPGDPIVGHVYTSGEHRFSCFYIDPFGTRYDLTSSPSSPFHVTFSLWEGQGGWAKGTFSGWMISAANDSLYFSDGYFENEIWTMGTR